MLSWSIEYFEAVCFPTFRSFTYSELSSSLFNMDGKYFQSKCLKTYKFKTFDTLGMHFSMDRRYFIRNSYSVKNDTNKGKPKIR